MTEQTMPAPLLALAERMQDASRRVAAQQEIIPMAFIADVETGSVLHAVPADTSSEEARRLTLLQIRGLVEGLGGTAVLLVSECWYYGGPDCLAMREKYGSTEKIPGALEVAVIYVETASGQWISYNEIERSAAGKRLGFRSAVFNATDNRGALSGFF